MAKHKLEDICEFITDGTHQTPEYCDENGVIFLSSKDVTEHKIDWDNVKYIPETLHEQLYKRLKPQKNDILLAKNGTTGVAAIVDRDEVFDVYVSLAVLRPKPDIYPKYLLYAINSQVAKRQFNAGLKGIGVPNLHLNVIRKTELNIAERDKQENICQLLDKVSYLIDLRQQQLEDLDNLIKARFVELFGDPITNPMGWKKEETNKHIDLLSGYPFKSEQYVEDGINICGGLIIMPQRIEWDSCVHWPSVEGYEDYLLNEGDIVMALDRPWITEGFKVARIDANHLPALLIQRTARIRAMDIDQDYLYYCFINGGFDKHSNVTGSLVPHISAKDIRSFEILIPPIELQKEFSLFMKQVDKSKVAVKKALDETQLLFDSLMQKYFG